MVPREFRVLVDLVACIGENHRRMFNPLNRRAVIIDESRVVSHPEGGVTLVLLHRVPRNRRRVRSGTGTRHAAH